MGGRKPSISHFGAREGGGARESPLSRRNMRGRVGGWQKAPPSHVSTRGRVVGLEKALRHVETQEEGWVGGRKPSVSRFSAREGGGARESPPSRQNTRGRVGGRKPLRLTFRREGGWWG